MLRRIGFVIVLLGSLLFIQCEYNWLTGFERIDADRIRILDFIYKNDRDSSLIEFMPGDSVTLFAYFAGQEITDIKWEVSFNVYKDIYGNDTAYDIQDLAYQQIPVDLTPFSSATQARGLKFVVPKDIMYFSKSIEDEYLTQTGMAKDQLLTLLDILIATDVSLWDSIPQIKENLPIIKQMAPILLQALTVPVQVFATINGVFKVKSEFSVRYNHFFRDSAGFSFVSVNKNPQVNFIGIYKVKEIQHPKFDSQKMQERDTSYCLFLADSLDSVALAQNIGRNVMFTDTITIDTGYTYYVMVDTGVFHNIDQRDSGVIMDTGLSLSQTPESFFSQWFFQHDFTEIAAVHPDDLMIINSNINFLSLLIPPTDTKVTGAVIWVQLFDFFLGERFRPQGSGLRETKIHFRYTPAYIDKESL